MHAQGPRCIASDPHMSAADCMARREGMPKSSTRMHAHHQAPRPRTTKKSPQHNNTAPVNKQTCQHIKSWHTLRCCPTHKLSSIQSLKAGSLPCCCSWHWPGRQPLVGCAPVNPCTPSKASSGCASTCPSGCLILQHLVEKAPGLLIHKTWPGVVCIQ